MRPGWRSPACRSARRAWKARPSRNTRSCCSGGAVVARTCAFSEAARSTERLDRDRLGTREVARRRAALARGHLFNDPLAPTCRALAFTHKKPGAEAGLPLSSADLSAEHAGRVDDTSRRKQPEGDQS